MKIYKIENITIFYNDKFCYFIENNCFVEDVKFGLRIKIAENPNTPKPILKKLSNDENKYVRKYAKQKLK